MKTISDYEMPLILKNYFSYIQTIKGKSENTIKVYFFDLRVFFRFLKLHKNLANKNTEFDSIDICDVDIGLIKDVTLSDLYAFMSYVSNKRDNSSRARARKVASLKSFYNYLANKAKLIDVNPASELESPKIVKRLPRYLNVDESKKLLGSVDGKHHVRNFAIITLFLNCGLRLSELVGLNMGSIKEDSIHVIGKGNKERNIPLNKASKEALLEYKALRETITGIKDKSAFFLSERKQRISKESVQKIVKKFIKISGLDPEKYSTHKLRHTAATLMYKYGHVDIRALQELLGHESIATTEIYTHLDSQQLRDAVNKNPLSDFSINNK